MVPTPHPYLLSEECLTDLCTDAVGDTSLTCGEGLQYLTMECQVVGGSGLVATGTEDLPGMLPGISLKVS